MEDGKASLNYPLARWPRPACSERPSLRAAYLIYIIVCFGSTYGLLLLGGLALFVNVVAATTYVVLRLLKIFKMLLQATGRVFEYAQAMAALYDL